VSIRGARVLLFGACSQSGRKLVEAFLAMGAEVIAADRLRTRLEELRAEHRQHERLWVAESDVSEVGAAAALFADVARDRALDAALLVVPQAEQEGPWHGDEAGVRAALGALPACLWFLRAARQHLGRQGHGRALLLLEPAQGDLHAACVAFAARLVASASLEAPGHVLGVTVCGAQLRPTSAATLDRVLALADPSQPPVSGWLGELGPS
jgi:NAD(P)-dependent dehydrogenase (short-subunit alcohol dehydrogenase family)